MVIPNDTGHPWRLNKFIEFQYEVPPIGPHAYLAWAKRDKLPPSQCVRLAWFYSVTYCPVTAILLQRSIPDEVTTRTLDLVWKTHKPNWIFTEGRMYAKSMNWFVPLMERFQKAVGRDPHRWLLINSAGTTPEERYNRIYTEVHSWPYVGRFAADLFGDAVVQMSREGLLGDTRFRASEVNWKNASHLTSGLLNVCYQDDYADTFDKTGKISPLVATGLDTALNKLRQVGETRHPDRDYSVSVVTPKLCSWRGMFKGRSYGGYDRDLQLENLRDYRKAYPKNPLWDEILELRAKILPVKFRGEVGGWDGIRKERKKLWLTTGMTGVEEEAQ